VVTSDNIVGHENYIGGVANELVLPGIRRWRHERDNRLAVGRSDGQPSFAGLEQGIGDKVEAELVQVKAQASLLVVHEDLDAVNAEDLVGRRLGRRGHGRDYKSDRVSPEAFLICRGASRKELARSIIEGTFRCREHAVKFAERWRE
jgi:hypothetical protein